MAMHLFEKSPVTLSQAARISALSVEDFLDLLNEVGIPAVEYPPQKTWMMKWRRSFDQ
jgi:predicted HTH domain antitoxin